jgi:dihydropteroate synthase
MGIVNVTDDSFSGDGLTATEAAIHHALGLIENGADLVDIGGESTRPGAPRVPESQELNRVIPVVRELANAGAIISVDTTRASVAAEAVKAGAHVINDVSGGLADPAMATLVAETGIAYVCTHWRTPSATMDSQDHYPGGYQDVVTELHQRLDALDAAGVRSEQIIVDPGLGFSKAGHINWEILAHTEAFRALGFPVLIGASRKRFLASTIDEHLANPASPAAPANPAPQASPIPLSPAIAPHPAAPSSPTLRDDATAAVTALAAISGAWAVRVHAARASRSAVCVAADWMRGRKSL